MPTKDLDSIVEDAASEQLDYAKFQFNKIKNLVVYFFLELIKLLHISFKEIKLVKSQKIALVLVLLYPAIVMSALALAFEEGHTDPTNLNKINASIYLPDDSNTFNSTAFLEKIEDNNFLFLNRVNSPEDVLSDLRLSNSLLGIIVNNPTKLNSTVKIQLFFDNSVFIAAKTISSQVKDSINAVGYQTSLQILGNIWQDLNVIETNLSKETSKADSFIATLDKTSKQLEGLDKTINEINLIPAYESLDLFDKLYIDARAGLIQVQGDSNSAQTNLLEYRKEVVKAKDELKNYSTELSELNSTISTIKAVTIQPVTSELEKLQDNFQKRINSINQTVVKLDTTLEDIDIANVKLQGLDAKLSGASTRLTDAKSSIVNLSSTIDGFQNTIDQARGLVEETSYSQRSISQDIQSTKKLLKDLVSSLEKLRQFNPSFLVNPVEVQETQTYTVSNLTVFTPFGLGLVLLLSCILLTSLSVILERSLGITFRTRLSPTSKLTWVSGKILGQLFFALVEVTIMLLMARYIFNVPLFGDKLDLLIALLFIGFSFISIGLFLTNFTKNQSTVVLSSLLIMIPMIFLSGIIFPLQFMPSFMENFSSVLPLTIANNLLISIMVKGTALSFLMPQLTLLALPAVVLVAFTYFHKSY